MLYELKIVMAIEEAVYEKQLTETFKRMKFDLYETPRDIVSIEIAVVKYNPHIVILNIDNMKAKEIRRIVKHLASFDNTPVIFTLYSYDVPIISELKKYISVICVEMPARFSTLCNEVEKIYSRTPVDITDLHAEVDTKIIELLSILNFTPKMFGYLYLREALFISSCTPQTNLNFSRTVYPAIAYKFSTTPACVERAIRMTISEAWNDASIHVKNLFFQIDSLKNHNKPTNNEFIMTIGNYVHDEYRHYFDKLEALGNEKIKQT